MPSSFIALALVGGFVLVWIFVGVMLLKSGRTAAHRDADLAGPVESPEQLAKRDARRSRAA